MFEFRHHFFACNLDVLPQKKGLLVIDQAPSSYKTIGQRVSQGNQKDIAAAWRKYLNSQSICFLDAVGSSMGNSFLLGLNMATGLRNSIETTSCCQSGHPVIPPAKNKDVAELSGYSVGDSMYRIEFFCELSFSTNPETQLGNQLLLKRQIDWFLI